MTKKILIYLLVLLPFLVLAQKEVSLNVDKNISLLDVLNLGQEGIVVKSGRELEQLKKRNISLKFFSPNLEEIWSVNLPDQKPRSNADQFLASSSSGNHIYNITIVGGQPFGQKSLVHWVHVDRNGNLREHLPEDELPKGYLQSVFCDEEYLYFVSTEKNHQNHKKKKVEERILISRYRHQDFAAEELQPELPVIPYPEISSFWEYAGNSNDVLFFSRKEISEVAAFKLIHLSKDGKVIREIVVSSPLTNDHLRPSFNLFHQPGAVKVKDNDFTTFFTGDPKQNNETTESLTNNVHVLHELGAYGNLRLVPQQNAFFLYGLYGPDPFRSVGNIYEGFFISKYDLDGELLFFQQFQMPAEIIDDSFFRMMASPAQRRTYLHVEEKGLVFRLWFKNEIHNIALDTEGKLRKYYTSKTKNSVTDEDFLSFQPAPETEAEFVLDKLDNAYLRKNRVFCFLYDKKHLVIQEDKKERKIYIKWLN
ncbi:MAG: hypothetical protein ACK4ND_09230 [Cytophagaceae bacterium]